jgi:DNA mismatch repair protein MutS
MLSPSEKAAPVTTPLRHQYLEIKRRYPHAILFFRLGDFYETFDEDAQTVAKELEITLTSRPVGKNQRVPLAGVPHHALDSYLAKLITKGYKVAVCEQMEEPGKGRKIVDRQVVRVVTPGTLVEENLLESGENNFLAAYYRQDDLAGIAYVDVSTGEFAFMQVQAAEAGVQLARLGAAEVLLPQGIAPPEDLAATLTALAPERFDAEAAEARLLQHFGGVTLDALGLAGRGAAAGACAAILSYLEENQPTALKNLTRLSCRQSGDFMATDSNTYRNLEVLGPAGRDPGGASLLNVLDATKTPMGARLLRRWLGQPLLDITAIAHRQECVQSFFDSAVRRGRTAALLSKVGDLERLLTRVATVSSGSVSVGTPRDLSTLGRGLAAVPALVEAVESDPAVGSGRHEACERMIAGLHPCREVVDLVSNAIGDDWQEGFPIRPGFSEELDSLRSVARDARQYLADLERIERERTGIKSLKVGYNRVFGYYIEVSKANAAAVPEYYQRKQTLVGGERYTTPQLQEHEYKVLHAQEQEGELEQSLLRQVCAQVAAHGERIRETAAAIALIDVCCALADVAARNGYTRPLVDDGDGIVIRDGRHPVVERALPPGAFVPNDTSLSSADAQIAVLTGPNMAGKSTYLRQVALIVLMAQIGSFVPAAEARIGLVDRICSRIGALDDIAAGRSTFMVEMLETAAMLHNATPRSLLIFDEIGRGTSTYDGMAIARAVVEFIHNRADAAAKTLFATHYHELTELAAFLPRVRNYNVAVTEEQGEVVFLHRILPGGADRSYGVHVAQLAGLPRPVIARAQELLEQLESGRAAKPQAAGRREPFAQMPLFRQEDGLRQEISELEVDGMTPLEAMTKLYELVEKARRKLRSTI